MSDGSTFVSGGVIYPLTAATTNALLQDCDPALYLAIQFFRSVILTHVGARLLAEAERVNLPMISAVAYTTNIDPGKHPIDTRFRYPLLAVYRQKTKRNYRTLNWAHGACTWGLTYLLPVMSTLQAETLDPILKAVGDVLDNRIERGADPAFASDQHVWTAAGIEEISFDSDEYGVFTVPEGTQFFAGWNATLLVTERAMPTPLTPLTGIDVELDLAVPGQTTINDYVDFKSDVVPPGPTTGGG